jgi:hypothetical protein
MTAVRTAAAPWAAAPTWAAQLPRDAAAVATFWNVADAEVCEATESLWLRGRHWDDTLELRLRKISGAAVFRIDDDGLLTPGGCLLPTARLPAGPWRALKCWLEVHLPPAKWPGAVAARAAVGIERVAQRASGAKPATAMLVPLDRFALYVDAAPQVRLRRWSFAANDAGNVLVRGTPLPPLAGAVLFEDAGVLIPCGFAWTPAIDAASLRRVLQLGEGDLALFGETGAWQSIAADAVVAVTRSAVRATVAERQRREAAR